MDQCRALCVLCGTDTGEHRCHTGSDILSHDDRERSTEIYRTCGA